MATWNSLPGVKPVESAQDQRPPAGSGHASRGSARGCAEPAAASRAPPAKPKAERRPWWRTGGQGRAREGQGGEEDHCEKARPTSPRPRAKRPTKRKRRTARRQQDGPGDCHAPAQERRYVRRDNERMGWQRHTVRGFMAGAMKKAGYAVESFKPEGGDRTYRIPSSIEPSFPPARPGRGGPFASVREFPAVVPHCQVAARRANVGQRGAPVAIPALGPLVIAAVFGSDMT